MMKMGRASRSKNGFAKFLQEVVSSRGLQQQFFVILFFNKGELAMLRRDVMFLCVFFLVFSLAGMASAQTYSVTSMGTFNGNASNMPRNYLAMGQNAGGGDTVVGILTSLGVYYWQGRKHQESSGTQLTGITPAGGSGLFASVSPNGSLAGGRGGFGRVGTQSSTRSPAPPPAGRY